MAFALALFAAVRAYGFGVDWGAEFHKSSTLLPGQHFRAVENALSARKTHNFFSICGEERFFEAQAMAKLTRPNCQSFYLAARLAHIADRAAAQRLLDDEQRHVSPHKLLADDFGIAFVLRDAAFLGGLNITRSEIANETNYLRIEEVIAMLMQRNIENANRTVGARFAAGVLALSDSAAPIRVRRLLRGAFALAGLRLDGVVQENVAAAVYDSLGRGDGPAQHIYFLNAGAAGARLSLLRYSVEREGKNNTQIVPTVSALSHISNDFSGHALDVCLAETVLAVARSSQRPTPPLAKTRLLYVEVKRVKEILSANKETQIFIEDFFDDAPLSLKVTRAMFERGCEAVFAKLRAALSELKAVGAALTPPAERVELLGGATRVPRVHEIVKEVLGVPLGARINGDEGMALGAALVAANATAGVRLQKVIRNDGPNYSVSLSVRRTGEAEPGKSAPLFEGGTARYGARKVVTLDKPEEGIELVLREVPGDYETRFEVRGVDDALARNANATEPQLSVSFELDGIGVPQLRRAELTFREAPTANATVALRREQLRVARTVELPLALEGSSVHFEESRELLRRVAARETAKQLLAEKRNKLESTAYSMRALAEEGSVYLTAAESEAFGPRATALSDFVEFEAASHNSLEALNAKLSEATESFKTLEKRKTEHVEREKLVPLLVAFLTNTTAEVAAFNATRPWLSAEEVAALSLKLAEEANWMAERTAAQRELPLSAEPAFTVAEARERIRPLRAEHRRLKSIGEPRPNAKGIEDIIKNLNITKEQFDELMKVQNATNASIEDIGLNANETNIEIEKESLRSDNETNTEIGDESLQSANRSTTEL